MIGRRICSDCGKDVEALTVHEHVQVHKELGI